MCYYLMAMHFVIDWCQITDKILCRTKKVWTWFLMHNLIVKMQVCGFYCLFVYTYTVYELIEAGNSSFESVKYGTHVAL